VGCVVIRIFFGIEIGLEAGFSVSIAFKPAVVIKRESIKN